MLLMLSTISLHILKWHSPYPASKGGWEYDLMLLTLASVLLVYGAGSFTLG
jgi:putative oxidoreductase